MNEAQVNFDTVDDATLKARIELKAPPEKVFAAWTRAEHFAKWFGPKTGGSLQVDEFDCQQGGKFDFTMIFADGDRVQMTGNYREVTPPTKLVFTWQWKDSPTFSNETLVTVDLVPTALGTHLTLTHDRFLSTEARDNHRSGWGPLLERLGKVLDQIEL